MLLPELLEQVGCDLDELGRLGEEAAFPRAVPLTADDDLSEGRRELEEDPRLRGSLERYAWECWSRPAVEDWLRRHPDEARPPDVHPSTRYDLATLERWGELGCGQPYAVRWPGELGRPARGDDERPCPPDAYPSLTPPDVADMVGRDLEGVARLVRYRDFPAPFLAPELDGRETCFPRFYVDEVADWLQEHPQFAVGEAAGAPAEWLGVWFAARVVS